MKIVQLSIGGKTIDCADCTHWTLHDQDARCAIGIEPMACADCAHGVPRQRLTPKPVPSIAARAVSWAKAEASVIVGEITQEEIDARIAACLACEHRDAGHPIGWCKRCGCGRSPAAELSRKARLPAATCPASRWRAL